MTVSPQSTVIESHYPFLTIYIHSCDSSCFSSVPPILSILYLRYQHGRPPPVVTIVPTEGESLLYLRYFIYAYIFLLCRYPTYNRLVLLRIRVVTIVPTEDILLTIVSSAHTYSFGYPEKFITLVFNYSGNMKERDVNSEWNQSNFKQKPILSFSSLWHLQL